MIYRIFHPLSILMLFVGAEARANDCFRPYPPSPDLYYGLEMAEFMREDYRIYFNDVESYLNCVNQSSAQVRQESRQTAYEFDRLLSQIPRSRSHNSGARYQGSLTEAGTLILAPHPEF